MGIVCESSESLLYSRHLQDTWNAKNKNANEPVAGIDWRTKEGSGRAALAEPQTNRKLLISFHLVKAAARRLNHKLSAAVNEKAHHTSADSEAQKAKLGSDVTVKPRNTPVLSESTSEIKCKRKR